MELGTESSALEKTKNLYVRIFDGFLLAIGYWFGVIVEDEDVVVAGGGWNNKAACLIRSDFACVLFTALMTREQEDRMKNQTTSAGAEYSANNVTAITDIVHNELAQFVNIIGCTLLKERHVVYKLC